MTREKIRRPPQIRVDRVHPRRELVFSVSLCLRGEFFQLSLPEFFA